VEVELTDEEIHGEENQAVDKILKAAEDILNSTTVKPVIHDCSDPSFID
jgi:hypothetical protein